MPPRQRTPSSNAGRIHPSLDGLKVPITDLRHYGRNPRRGDVDVIRESLIHNGQYRPIVSRKGTNEVLAGNHTLKAARSLDWPEIATTWVEVTDDEAERIVLVDNSSNDMAGYDNDELLMILQARESLAGTGFSDARVAALAQEVLDAEGALPEGGDAPTGRSPEVWGIIITCDDETQQVRLLRQLESEGLNVRAMIH